MNKTKGWKTVIFNTLVGVGSLLAMWGVDIQPEDMGKFSAAIVSTLTIGNLILRAVTNSPIFKK